MAEDAHPTKAGSLIDKVWYLPHLRRAWTLVKANHGAYGVDRQSLEAFEAHLEEELQALQTALKADAYVPQPGRRVYIPKPDGRKRKLVIPAVRDRVVQQALRLRLEPYFGARFAETSYGFRPGRSAHQAIGDVLASLHHRGEWIVEVDIERFFDTASHERLLLNRDDQGLHLQPRARAVQRVKEKIRHLTRRTQPKSVDQIVAQLNPVIVGWGRYFRIGELRQIGRRLDRWILRRLRAFLAKRWRTANWRRYSETFFYRCLGLRSLQCIA